MAGPGSGVDGRTRPGFKWKSARNTAPSGSDAAKPVQQPAQESGAEEAEMPHLLPTQAPEIPVQAAFANGEMVEIIGLQGALDLNGRVGIVREFDPASRRHRVELLEEDGSVRQVRVRPANLDLLSAEEFMPSCASKKEPPTVSKDPATQRPSQPVRTSREEPEMAVALANAVNQCDLFQVQALLRDRADPNGHSQSPGTPLLFEAAAKTAAQSLDLAALLLGYSADPDAVLDRPRSAKAVRSEKEVETLCQIFRSKSASTEEERAILSKLDAGALAQARRLLKLSGPFALGGIAPAVCLEESSSCQELEATKAHRLFLHSADGLRPVLVMRPSGGQPSALVVLLHGLFQRMPWHCGATARPRNFAATRNPGLKGVLMDPEKQRAAKTAQVMPTALCIAQFRLRCSKDGWSVGPVRHCALACTARRFNLMALYNMGFHDAKLAWGNWDYVDLSHFSNIPPGGELRTSAVMFVKECREKAHPPGLFASVASFTAGIALHRIWHHQKKSEKVTIPRLVELPNRKACSEVPPSNWALPLVLKCSGAAVLVMAASRKVRRRIWKGARLLDLKRNVSRASSTPSEAPSPVPVAPAHSVDGSVWREAVGGAPHPRVQEAPTCIPWTSQNVHVRGAPPSPAAGADKAKPVSDDAKPQADKSVASVKPEADKIPPPAVKPAKPEAEETPAVDVKPELDKIPSTDVKPEAEETPPMDVKPEVDTSPESKAMPNESASKGKGPQGKGPPLKGKGKGKMPSQSPPEGKGSTGKAAIRALVEAAKQQTELPEPRNRKWSAPKSTGTSLLDTSRATNLAIMLKKLPVSPAEFCECVKMLDSSHSQIAVGHVELVLANMPSQSEAHKLLSYDGNEGPLRDVEAEVLPLCSLSASAVKVFKIAMEHEDVYARHMARCRTISNAAQEVCRSRELRELLTLILHTGKYINSGAPGANAAETFTVESLQSLSTFKIGPISALHFLCISFRGMKREFLQLLLSNLRHVHAAAKEKFGQLDVDIHSSFQDDVKAVENRLEQVKQEVQEQCHYERLAMLTTQMTSELAALRTSFASAKQLVAEAQAYCDGASRESMPAELFFQHVATFLGIFRATWEEIDAQPAKWRKYLSEAVTANALSNDITAWAQQLARQSIKDRHEVPSRQTSSDADVSSSGHAFSDVSSVSNAEAKKLKFPAMNFVGIHADQANHSPLPSNLPTRSPSPTLRAQVQIAITPEESGGVQRLSSSHIRKIRQIAATDLFTTFAIHSPAQEQVPAVKITGQRGADGSHTDLGESKQRICRGASIFLVSVVQWAKWGNIAIRISGSEQSEYSRWWRQGFILGKQRIIPCGFTTPELQFTGTAWFDHTRSARKAEALEECRSEILALLSSQGHEWGITPERVVLAGFSMGGTLAAWTALQ
ncbi:FH3, partial [Symbiodinium sp. CCMP2592]